MAHNTLIHNFTSGSIPRHLLRFAAPLFLSNLLQIVYNMVDMIIVGHVLEKAGLSAVSVGGDLAHFLTFIAMGFSAAGQVIIAQYVGAQERQRIGRFIATMFVTLASAALILSIGSLLLRNQILSWMNTPKVAWDDAMDYSVISACGLVFVYGYNMLSAVLRGLGDSKHPFIFISIAAVLNILLDLLFVVVLDMRAGGAALATIISQCVSFLSCALFLYKRRATLGFTFRLEDFRHPDKSMFLRLVQLGIPMAIKSASVQISKLFVNSWINSFSDTVSAFSGIAGKFNNISNLVASALNTAGSSMIGQHIGARSYKRVPRIILTIAIVMLTFATCSSILLWIFPQEFFGIFTTDSSVIAIGLEYLPIGVLILFASACRAPFNALINGSGIHSVNFATAILDGIVLRVGLSMLFGLGLGMGYLGFFLGDAIAGFTPMVLGLLLYLSGRWKQPKPA